MKRFLIFLLATVLLLGSLVFPAHADGVQMTALDKYVGCKFTRDFPVYSGPGENYVRPGNSNSMMRANNTVYVFGYTGDWLLVGFEVEYKKAWAVGYVSKDALNYMSTTGVNIPELTFQPTLIGYADDYCRLTEDPLWRGGEYMPYQIPNGTAFTVLAVRGETQAWTYIEVNTPQGPMRGFVWSIHVKYNGGQVPATPIPSPVPTARPTPAPTALPALYITRQPQSVTVPIGANYSISVQAQGQGLTYTWYYKPPTSSTYAKSMVTSATYTNTAQAQNNGYQFYCVVTDQFGQTVASSSATLYVSNATIAPTAVPTPAPYTPTYPPYIPPTQAPATRPPYIPPTQAPYYPTYPPTQAPYYPTAAPGTNNTLYHDTSKGLWFPGNTLYENIAGSWPVYSGPGTYYWRAADGRASVAGSNCVIYGVENGWALIGYTNSSGAYRMGYISASALPQRGLRIPYLDFAYRPGRVTASAPMTDDIMRYRPTIATLTPQTGVLFLGYINDSGNNTWAFVEVLVNNSVMRGFIPAAYVMLQ